MDNVDESEKNAKVPDSAYSNSCSNSQSRRSLSSKSTHSASNSSGSSGYGGKQSTSGSSTTLSQEKRTKDTEGKNQQAQTELVQMKTDVEFRLPAPAPIIEAEEELQIAAPPPASDQTENAVPGTFEAVNEKTVENVSQSRFTIGRYVVFNVPSTEKQRTIMPDVIPQVSTNALATNCILAEGFSCLISMHDGVVLYMSSSLTEILGFPRDMWVGRSFIDFIHPFDHKTFASQMTNGMAVPKATNVDHTAESPVTTLSTIFCRMRRYRTLARGFNVKGRTVRFIPFMLKLSFKNVCEKKGSTMYLVIQAKPVLSAYKTPNEVIVDPIPFVMRHVANGNLEYIDNVSVPLLGYMPQEITSSNMLKLYDPVDLPYLRHLYKTTMKHGRANRSEPYRLMAQNGDYLKLETEWSSLINPWSRKLEFVIGKHYIIEGPANPDVFQPPPTSKATKVPEDDDSETEDLRESIVRILNEVPTRPAEKVKQDLAKRCTDLASIMESLIKEQPVVEQELRVEIHDNDNSNFEPDSVILRGISPHHDYSDKSSTGTATTYDRLNYNNNLKRFFDSHLEAFSRDSANVTDQSTSAPINRHFCFGECTRRTAQYSGESTETSSSESPFMAHAEEGSVAVRRYHSVWLTESIMTRHNSEMEKIFVKNQRENRPAKREERVKLSIENKQMKKDHLLRCNASFVPTANLNTVNTEPKPHGLKRQQPRQTEMQLNPHKHQCSSSRQLHHDPPHSFAGLQPSASTAPAWSYNYVNRPVIPQQISVLNSVPGIGPMYYKLAARPAVAYTPGMSAHGFTNTTAPVQYQAPPVHYMIYGQVYGPPVVVSPATFPKPPGIIHNQAATFPEPPGAIHNHRATFPEPPGVIQNHGATFSEPPGEIHNHGATFTEPPGAIHNHGATFPEPPGAIHNHGATFPEPPGAIHNHGATIPEPPGAIHNHGATFPEPPGAIHNHGATFPEPPGAIHNHGATFPEPPGAIHNHGATFPEPPGAIHNHGATFPEPPGAIHNHGATILEPPGAIHNHGATFPEPPGAIHNHGATFPEPPGAIHNHGATFPEPPGAIHNHGATFPEPPGAIHNHGATFPEPPEAIHNHGETFPEPPGAIHNHGATIPEPPGAIHNHGATFPEPPGAIHNHGATFPEPPGAIHNHGATIPEPPGAIHNHGATFPEPPGAIHNHGATFPEPPGAIHNHRATFPEPPGAIHNHGATIPEPPGAIHNHGATFPEPPGAIHNHGATFPEPPGATHNHGATFPEPPGAIHNHGATFPEPPGVSHNHSASFPEPPRVIHNHGATVPKSPGEIHNHGATFTKPSEVIQKQLICPQNNISLSTRNFEEACKPGLVLKPSTKAQMAAWREEKRAAEVATKLAWIRPWAERSTDFSMTCSSTNALNRSSEEIADSCDLTDGESSFSSFYSSFFRTDSGSAQDSSDAMKHPDNLAAPMIPGKDNLRNMHLQKRKKEPPWMEQVRVTPELIYKYQVATKDLDEVLLADRKKLMAVEQPALVNEQLGQLYKELELEGAAARLTLDEGMTSSSSSSDDGQNFTEEAVAKRAKRRRKYSKLVMIYEEEAPLPCPDANAEPVPSTSGA